MAADCTGLLRGAFCHVVTGKSGQEENVKKKKSNPQENKSQEIMILSSRIDSLTHMMENIIKEENKSQEVRLLSSRIDSLTYLMESIIKDLVTQKYPDARIKSVKTECTLDIFFMCMFILCFVTLVYHRVTDTKTPAAEPVNASVTSQYPIPGIEGNFLNITELTSGKSVQGEK